MATWVWPAPGNNTITSGVGPRWGKTHKGIDISGASASGKPVVASRAGVVKFAGYGVSGSGYGGYGNVVDIDHQDGYVTRYGHMLDNSLTVKTGDRVVQGQQIGKVGSTGKSTGPHLHFEVRYNGSTKDPEEYVSPDNTIVVADTPESTYESAQYYSAGTIPYSPEAIVGTRTSEFSTQPMMPFVNIYIGDDKLLTTDPPKPNVIQSFEINRLESAGSTASFTIYDDNWDEIEKILSDNFDRIVVEYGYVDGVRSNAFPLMLQNYSISFTTSGTIMSFSAMTQGQYSNLNQVFIKTDTYNPTVAVKSICKQAGFIVRDENFDATMDVEMDNPFNSVQEFPIAYILQVIVPLAQTENGEILTFYLDENNVAYFKKKSFATNANKEIKTYVYQSGYDSVVKDINFDIKGVFGGTDNFSTATGLTSNVFGPIDKSQSIYKSTTVSTITESTGEYQHTKESQSISLVDAAGNTANQMKNKLYYYMKNQTSGMYEATMTIIGDPTISLLDNVRIINITESGFLHHTSGIYMVSAISDSISDGDFYTTLKLIRNGDINDGVELLNPKTLLK